MGSLLSYTKVLWPDKQNQKDEYGHMIEIDY